MSISGKILLNKKTYYMVAMELIPTTNLEIMDYFIAGFKHLQTKMREYGPREGIGEGLAVIYEIYPLKLIHALFPKTHEKLTKSVEEFFYKKVITYNKTRKEQRSELKSSREPF